MLANVVSKGGNLMLNVGPDGKGNIPYYSVKYLSETGKWLRENGESIYGTTYGFIAPQPWAGKELFKLKAVQLEPLK